MLRITERPLILINSSAIQVKQPNENQRKNFFAKKNEVKKSCFCPHPTHKKTITHTHNGNTVETINAPQNPPPPTMGSKGSEDALEILN